MKRKPHTPQARARISAALRATWADPEKRKRHSELTRMRMARPGAQEKISERTKAALADPEIKTRHVAGLKKAFADPALRQKISERTRAGMRAKRDAAQLHGGAK